MHNPTTLCLHPKLLRLPTLSKKLLKSAAVVSSMTLLSRILGFTRDVVLARMFGVDAGTDAFFLAFKIPNFLRRLFAEGAFSQAFVPVFTEYKETKPEELPELINRVSGTLGLLLFITSIIGVTLAPILIIVFGPGFVDEPAKYDLATQMLRLTFPYLFFIALTALAAGILNSFGQFSVPAFTPVLLNLCLISAAIWVAPQLDTPIMALAGGVFIAGLMQLLFQLPFLYRLKLLPKPQWGWHHPGVKKIRTLMIPALFGSSVAQINLLLDTVIASFLVTGSISWLYYSDRLVEFPLGLFGIAVATVILPKLSKDHSTAAMGDFSATLDWALRLTLLISLPASIGLALLSGPMLTTLFLGGEFGRHDVAMAQLSLMAYSLGLVGFILVKVLAPGFYARQDTKTPVKIGIIAMIVNMGLNLVFVLTLIKIDFVGTHMGLALATSASALLNATLLLRGLRRRQVYTPRAGWYKLIAKLILANLIMGLCLAIGIEPLSIWQEWTVWERVLHLTKWLLLGIVVYGMSLILVGVKFKSYLKNSI